MDLQTGIAEAAKAQLWVSRALSVMVELAEATELTDQDYSLAGVAVAELERAVDRLQAAMAAMGVR